MSSTDTTDEATSTPTTTVLIAEDPLRSTTMSTMTEPLRHMVLEHLPVREKIELIPFQEMLDRLPVQEVIERLPQRFRPEPPKRSKKPLLFALLAVGAIVAFMMMKRRRAQGDEMQEMRDTGMVGVVPTTGAGFDESSTVRSSAPMR